MHKDEIRAYWDERAECNVARQAATTDDVYLRELEIVTIAGKLRRAGASAGTLLDVGCGDGYSTLRIIADFPELKGRGVDYIEGMIRLARANLEEQPELQERITFGIADVTALTKSESTLYDFVTTDRCLINLTSYENQRHAIAQIAAVLRPGGHYIAVENFVEGQEAMNAARRSVDLPEIPIRWHNLFFEESAFRAACEPHFEDLVIDDFSSSYSFATRVIYSAMCRMRGEEPDYRHEIHQLAVKLPSFGQFSPIRVAVMRRKQ
jgi:SAM-dependent methyltransferase